MLRSGFFMRLFLRGRRVGLGELIRWILILYLYVLRGGCRSPYAGEHNVSV